MARTLLIERKIALYFWVEVVSTACYIINRVFLRPSLVKKSPMSFSKVENQIFHVSEYLIVNVLF